MLSHTPKAVSAALPYFPAGTEDGHLLRLRGQGGGGIGGAPAGDALIEIMMDDELDLSIGPRLSQGLAEALHPVAPAIGAFAATGGETAAILLSRFGVNGIRLADEIEPGVSLGLTLGKLSVPVATKAGAFGDRYSLIRISERLRAVRIKGSFT